MEIKYWRLRTKAESAFVLNKTMTWNGIENEKRRRMSKRQRKTIISVNRSTSCFCFYLALSAILNGIDTNESAINILCRCGVKCVCIVLNNETKIIFFLNRKISSARRAFELVHCTKRTTGVNKRMDEMN